MFFLPSNTLSKLPGAIQPKFEKYCHPSIFSKSPKKWIEQGIMGDFLLALDEKKTLVCPVTNETAKKHAMVMYDSNDEEFIFKNSYVDQPPTNIPISNCDPKIGYYIRFWVWQKGDQKSDEYDGALQK